MKRIIQACVALWLLLSGVPRSALAQTEVLMPQFGKVEMTVPAEGLDFYDMKGTGSISSSSSNNSYATIVFKPAAEGQVVRVDFSMVDVRNDGSSWPAYLHIYNGTFDPDNTVAYPTTTGGVGASTPHFPVNDDLLAALDGQYANLSYISTASDGCLSVCYHYRYAKACEGWVARVTSIETADMTLAGAGVSYEAVDCSPIGQSALGLFSFYLDTEGFANADHLTSVSLTLPLNESVADPSTLSLYAGQLASLKDASALETSLSTAGEVYTLTLDHTLATGRNWFTVGVGLRAEAAFGSRLQGVLQGLTTRLHPEGLSDWVGAEPATIVLPAVVLMSAAPAVYDVTDQSILFYDDGGPEGNISSGFEGQVTFRPTTPGKKVMIDFTKLDLFNTSSVGYNDRMNVYDGSSVDENHLLATYLMEKAATVKSTADDGALTVTLKSTTGVPKSGFEATVSEFTPQPMVVESLTQMPYTTGTVAAGDEGQLILGLNVRTQHTLAPIEVQRLCFSAEGTTVLSDLTKATVYYTAGSASFDSSVRVGETLLTGEGTFEVEAAQALREGDNYFWLAYDLDVKAANGHTVDASVRQVVCSGRVQVPSENKPAGGRTVENTFESQNGSATRTVYDAWNYTHTCNYADATQQVTFLPATEGYRTELEFSAFNLYVTTYNVPRFAIYSGTEVVADKLLWQLTTADKAPALGERYRPLEGDCALTVVYDVNGSNQSSYYGWTAVVRAYRPQPMKLEGVEVAQADDRFVAAGSADQSLLRLLLTTTGDQSPLPLTGVDVHLKGHQADLTRLSLYYTARSDAFETTRLVGSVVVDAGSETVTIPLEEDHTLAEGVSYYWIAADVSPTVVPGTGLDVAVQSLHVGGQAFPVADGDPDGEREVKNICYMPTETGEVVRVGAYPYVFYDDGGADGNYSSVQNGRITFVPDEGQVIRLTFVSFKTSYNDYLRIYSGDASSTDLLGQYAMYSEPAEGLQLLSTAADGSVTVIFDRKGYSVNTGWEILVESYTPQPLTLASVTSEAVGRKQMLAGTKGEKLLRIALQTQGDRGEISVDQLDFRAAGTPAAFAMQAYYTASDSTFTQNGAAIYGESQSGATPVFCGTQTLTAPGRYFFWLACDVQPDAQVGQEVSAELVSVEASGQRVEPAESDVATVRVKDGFHGLHTVGAGGEYPTLGEAVADMAVDGINGPVVLSLAAGTYDEAVIIPEIAGTSATNTITICSASGNRDEVVLCSSHYMAGDYGSSDNGMLTLDGVDYLTLRDLSFETTDQNYPYLLDIRNASTHVSILGCRFTRPVEATTKRHLVHTDYVNNPVNGRPNTDMTLEGNLFEGGYIGVEVGGLNTTEANRNSGTRVVRNVFRNQYSKALYAKYDTGTHIEGNVIECATNGASEFDAMDLFLCYGNVVVAGNAITLTGDYAYGLKLRPLVGTETDRARVYNNTLSLAPVGTGSASYGIYLSNSLMAYADLAYNTIRLVGTSTGSAAFFSTAKSTGVEVMNNIFQNEAAGYAYRLNATSLNALTFHHNVLYTTGETLVYTADAYDMEGWVALGRETDSYNEPVVFQSDEVLSPLSVGNLNHAQPLDYVSTDKAGVSRDGVLPTIGAYEYVAPVRAEMDEGYPKLQGEAGARAATVLIRATEHAEAFFLCVGPADTPDADEVVAAGNKVTAVKGQETEVILTPLVPGTSYRVYFVLRTLADPSLLSALNEPLEFTTALLPTAVSTFEEAVSDGADFEDGTALFHGFRVEDIADGQGEDNYRAARMTGSEASITLTNTTDGLELTGFYLKSDADVTVTPAGGTSYTIASTEGEWRFCNLKDRGPITSLQLSTEGSSVWIDNFSGQPQPLTFFIDSSVAERVQAGSDVALSPYLYGGVPPYTYVWMNAGRQTVSTDETYIFPAAHTAEYILAVTDAWGVTEEQRSVVLVESEPVPATFDDLYLEDEHFDKREAADDGNYFLYSGTYAFANRVGTYDGMKYWSGFSYSNVTATAFTGNYLREQYYSAAGSGADGSRNYAVAYAGTDGQAQVCVEHSANGGIVSGCYVTNSAWAQDAIRYGDGLSVPRDNGFATGDYFRLTATGYDADDVLTGTTDCYLADFRSDNAAEHYSLDTWQWFDLRPLGLVKRIVFSLYTTKHNSFGMTTPAYFCLDGFGAEAPQDPTTLRDGRGREAVVCTWLTSDLIQVSAPWENYRLEVVDVSGCTVYAADNCRSTRTIAVNGLPEGVYLLRLTDGKHTVVRRFLRMK
ncbi:MAG: DUF4465 domain-containing protein [Bacteroidaceae bacterium]